MNYYRINTEGGRYNPDKNIVDKGYPYVWGTLVSGGNAASTSVLNILFSIEIGDIIAAGRSSETTRIGFVRCKPMFVKTTENAGVADAYVFDEALTEVEQIFASGEYEDVIAIPVEWIWKGILPTRKQGQGTMCRIKEDVQIEINKIINEYNSKKMITKISKLLETNKNLILTGAPGTGKTFTAKDIAEQMIYGSVSDDKKQQAEHLKKSPQFKLVLFHPAYTYEDFVRGVVMEISGGTPTYKTVNKTLGEFAQDALIKKKTYILIIDEINRANLPAVLGELLYALEYRDEKVETMYKLDDGDNSLVLPENLYIIGTMNTADRSVGQIDYAIRRRFAFVECLPKVLTDLPDGKTFETDLFKEVSKLFIKNIDSYETDGKLEKSDLLSAEFRPEDVWIGHSYFIIDDKKTKEYRLKYEIKPILKEYLKDGILTASAEDKINELK